LQRSHLLFFDGAAKGATNNIAENLVAHQGIDLLGKTPVRKIRCIGDSQVVISALLQISPPKTFKWPD